MPVELPDGLMVSVSGIRGRVGDPLTPELVAAVAAAYGAFLRGRGGTGPMHLGRDSRTSGPMLARAAVAGLQSVGCDVVELGVVPTPTLLLSAEDAGALGAVGITASHNPAEWNALKLATGEGMFLDGEASSEFRRFLREEETPRAPWDALGSVEEDDGAVDRHLERILALQVLDVEGIRERGFTVALDCVHGAGGMIMSRLLEALGCEVNGIGLEPDGRFPRDPEPTAEHLEELGELVRTTGADVGLAVDPDVDRLALVDERGRPLGEDLTLALAAAVVLKRGVGPVVTNLSTSQVVGDVAREVDAPVVLAPVGEINVARKMQEVEAVVGGEGNGGVILPALHGTRDAPVGAALVLQHLVDTGATASEAAARWPPYRILKEKVAFPRSRLDAAYRLLSQEMLDGEQDVQDGLRLTWPERREWLHVRPSGTEPVVRLIAEAGSEERARYLVEEARRCLEAAAE